MLKFVVLHIDWMLSMQNAIFFSILKLWKLACLLRESFEDQFKELDEIWSFIDD